MTLVLNLSGFSYADLYCAERLPALDALFRGYLAARDPGLPGVLAAYRNNANAADAETLLALARALEDFLVDAFGVHAARDELRARQLADAPIHAFKEQFVKRHARRRRATPLDFATVQARIAPQLDEFANSDAELALARLWWHAHTHEDKVTLAILEDWVWAACNTAAGREHTRGWVSLRLPSKLDHFKLVVTEPLAGDPHGRVQGPAARRRARDGFALTDSRASLREAMDQIHYCVYCHDHAGDFCSRGFIEKDTGAYRRNPLGIELVGCPLGEKISEAHTLKLEGFGLAALATVMIDNPLVPATGHRICNDCMKACVYQKQQPVDVPQIETRILTDVLSWDWGFEIYFALTRWNPLNRARPFALPDHGRRALCVGAGPAGFNFAYHLMQQGVGVALIDGLRIEKLPVAWTGDADTVPQPIARIEELQESLDERAMTGFGGVAEYGITVRWDKNFLKLVHLTLARNRLFRVYGGIRFGGTLTLDDAWTLGFDHVALATGAGKPAVIPLTNNLAHGLRQANDFLMALQLTGAAKRASLANLQIRLPAVVIGGGLTAIDTATEVQAYYIRQVEKLLARHEALGADGELGLDDAERAIFAEYLRHAHAVRAERARALAAGTPPDFARLLREWGGVTVVYRRAMNESPAYLRNHEEIDKALQEGIYYREALDPVAATLDAVGHVSALRFRAQYKQADGSWRAGTDDDIVELPARSVLMATGSSPNTAYEREYPGTFAMDGRYYAMHRAHPHDPMRLERVDTRGHCKDEALGMFTSYQNAGRFVSFLGDNHPRFHGSVVRAMASGRRAADDLAAVFARQARTPAPRNWSAFAAELDRRLQARVVAVERIGAHSVKLTVHAPQAVANWRPGQIFRLQNYEARGRRVDGTLLQMEGMAVSGMQADCARGELQLLLNEVGTSSRIAAQLPVGEPVVLMGPTGTALPAPRNQTITLIGNQLAALQLIAGAAMWRAAGNRIVFVGHFPNADAARAWQAQVEDRADEVLWLIESGPLLAPLRANDRCRQQTLDAFLAQCAHAPETLATAGAWLTHSNELLVAHRPQAMRVVADALRGDLRAHVRADLRASAIVNSPMQCMMKEVCAQCLCRQRETESGGTRALFSCFNQHQALLDVDFDNLAARHGQNSVQEKIGNRWLTHLLAREAHS